ncbi:hypothetical protein [Paenibacillus turpanensis]|uniref:hypothetical protein n=1 Tax=Paenibacillus turpanensis TaxID=2689078 RepID=UPI00140D8B49|nr:hypothetical protein [Paenibacillus turpanensis]
MIVACWGPVHGQVGTTSNLVAIATLLALDYHLRILVCHSHSEPSLLERNYMRNPKSELLLEGGGLDAIGRLVHCGLLTPEGLRDNTESVLKNRLDFLAGPDSLQTGSIMEIMVPLLEVSKSYYDLTFVDIVPGAQNPLSDLVLTHADLVVVNLNQNEGLLEQFFTKTSWPTHLEQKRILYVLGKFERSSKYTMKRLSKRFAMSESSLHAVPYQSKYMDALNEQLALEYLIRASNAKARMLEFNEDAYFIASIRRFNEQMLKMLELSPRAEVTV